MHLLNLEMVHDLLFAMKAHKQITPHWVIASTVANAPHRLLIANRPVVTDIIIHGFMPPFLPGIKYFDNHSRIQTWVEPQYTIELLRALLILMKHLPYTVDYPVAAMPEPTRKYFFRLYNNIKGV